MELGGKSAAIAFADVDLEQLLRSVKLGIFYNSGQVCSAMSRLLVHRSRYEEVKAAVVNLAESLTVGIGESNAELTPVVSKDQQQQILAMIDK
ncbi:aldehyde dehydrogenase family protein, partial [Acinetobacter baumannii]